jgi:hypothetical protein
MRSSVIVFLFTLLTLGLSQAALADDCVDVDVELTPEAVVGEALDASFELTNCGDEADTVWVDFDLVLFNDQTVDLPAIPVLMGAGEVISHQFSFNVPQGFSYFVGNTFEVCVTATSGTAEASDCASTLIADGSSASASDRGFDFNVSMSQTDCVDVDFELADTVYTKPGDFFADASFELTNCGDEAATIYLEPSVEGMDLAPVSVPIRLGAGETISRELRMPVPPAVPEGSYVICLTATSGSAMTTSCQEIQIMSWTPPDGEGSSAQGNLSASNFPNPFNPTTNIAFNLPTASEVSITVYNTLGQQVRSLIDDETLPAGQHTVVWDGTNQSGNQVASGMYFYRLETGNEAITKKMIMLK